MQQLRVPFSITVGGSLSANGQVVPDLLNSQGMGFVSANALLSIQAAIDPPPHTGDQVYMTLQRKTGPAPTVPSRTTGTLLLLIGAKDWLPVFLCRVI